MDPVQLVRKLAQKVQVRFAEQLFHMSLIGEAQSRAKVAVYAWVDLPDEGEVVFVQGCQAQQFRWNAD